MSLRALLAVRAAQVATVLAVLFVWDRAGQDQPLTVSTPSAVLTEVEGWITGDDGRWSDLAVTANEAALGFGLAMALGVTAAVVIASWAPLLRFSGPFVGLLNALPKIALAPLFVVLFGIDLQAKVLFVAAVLSFIPFFNLLSTVQGIDVNLIRNLRMLGAGRLAIFREVYVPATSLALVTSLRLMAAWALPAAIVSEIIASSEGVGFVMKEGENQLRMDIVLGSVVVVAAIAFAFDRIVVAVERRYTRWRPA